MKINKNKFVVFYVFNIILLFILLVLAIPVYNFLNKINLNDDEYYDTVWADRDVKEQVNQLAVKTYGQEVMVPPTEMADDDFPPPPQIEEAPVPAVSEPFSDEDIPF